MNNKRKNTLGRMDEVGKQRELKVGFEGLTLQMRESEGRTGTASVCAIFPLLCVLDLLLNS